MTNEMWYVIIGGLIGIVGGVIGGYFNHLWTIRRDVQKAKHEREKLLNEIRVAQVRDDIVLGDKYGRGGGGEITYIVQQGDSIHSVALAHGVNLEDVISLNSLQFPYHLEIGQELIIPWGGTPPPSPASTPPAGAVG